MASRVVERGDVDMKQLDTGIKNVWKWEWLERKVDGHLVGKFIRKINLKGMAFCELCQKELCYAGRGWKSLEQHLQKKLHMDNLKIRSSNYSLSGAFGKPKTSTTENNIPYGIHPMFRSAAVVQQPVSIPLTPLIDRVTNAESMILGFLAENSLSFSLAPGIIDLAKTLATDKKALDSVSMNRTTASYKTRFGLGKTFDDKLIATLRDTSFSLNIDESTSNNFQKVLTVLASYFCPVKNQVVIQHFASVACIKVNSDLLFQQIVSLMEKNNLPWNNLLSILMDSCNVMRGSKSGLETKIRNEKAPHLLDIDGDVCHHVHNAAKAFCKPFDYFIERLFSDLFNDFKWSPDLRELLQEVCEMCKVKYTMPQRYVGHRWLSVYDVTLDTLRLFDCLTIFYFPWTSRSSVERAKFLPAVVEIYNRLGVSESSRERLQEIRQELLRKNLTKDGQARKDRIVDRLFHERPLTNMVLGLYSSVLPLLKKVVMIFETKEPLIHALHSEQVSLLKEFLGCYVKPEIINTASSSAKLKTLDIMIKSNLLTPEKMFIGTKAQSVAKSPATKHHIVKEFLDKVSAAYVSCGRTLQGKLPITNPLLKAVSAIHPDARGHTLSLKYLKKLPFLVTTVLREDEMDQYDLDIRNLQQDETNHLGEDERVDIWWGKEPIVKMYPSLSKMAKALLSSFHGPQVESSFNTMNDIIDAKSGRINIETYNAIQNIKYGPTSAEKSSVQFHKKKDHLHERIDPLLCQNIRSSYKQYKEVLESKKKLKLERSKKLDIELPKAKMTTKRKAKELYAKAAKRARLAHSKSISQAKPSKSTSH